MIHFILLFTLVLFLSAIFINGFYNIIQKGMVFGFWETWIIKLPKWLYKPLGGCITCLSSIFGTICWLFWYHIISLTDSNESSILTGFPLIVKIGLWIFFCVSLAWANEIIFIINHKLKQHEKSNKDNS